MQAVIYTASETLPYFFSLLRSHLCSITICTGQGEIKYAIGGRVLLDETFDVGKDTGTPVIEDYVDMMPFKFTGILEKVVIELGENESAIN